MSIPFGKNALFYGQRGEADFSLLRVRRGRGCLCLFNEGGPFLIPGSCRRAGKALRDQTFTKGILTRSEEGDGQEGSPLSDQSAGIGLFPRPPDPEERRRGREEVSLAEEREGAGHQGTPIGLLSRTLGWTGPAPEGKEGSSGAGMGTGANPSQKKGRGLDSARRSGTRLYELV